jgi:hypothetical protein
MENAGRARAAEEADARVAHMKFADKCKEFQSLLDAGNSWTAIG